MDDIGAVGGRRNLGVETEGTMIVNQEQIDPAPVQTGAMAYPDDIEEWIKSKTKNSLFVETKEALKEAGSRRALNIVMLGVLSRYLDFKKEEWNRAIQSLVKEKFVEMNVKAFELGSKL